MPTSGVPKRARSVAMRRSQLAANSSAPPMQTPSMAASTGTGAASVALRHALEGPTVAAHDSGVASMAANRSSPAEKCSPAPRATTQRTLSSAPAASMRVGDRLDRVARPGVAIGLAVPRHHARRPQLASPSLRHLDASSSSPRAVRYTTRVFCSPTGSVPGATACTSKRAPSSVRSAASTPSIAVGRLDEDAQRRDDRVAVGHHRVAAQPVEAPEHRADRARVHVDRLHAQHVVDAALDADPRAAAPAGARRRPHAREVARAVAQQRRGLAAQVGPHELAEGVVLERERRAGPGLDELEQRPAVGGQVQPLGAPRTRRPSSTTRRSSRSCRPPWRPRSPRSARAPRPGRRRARRR